MKKPKPARWHLAAIIQQTPKSKSSTQSSTMDAFQNGRGRSDDEAILKTKNESINVIFYVWGCSYRSHFWDGQYGAGAEGAAVSFMDIFEYRSETNPLSYTVTSKRIFFQIRCVGAQSHSKDNRCQHRAECISPDSCLISIQNKIQNQRTLERWLSCVIRHSERTVLH